MTKTAEARGQSCNMSLVKAHRFHVATEICSVATRSHGVVSPQSFLCRDRVWPRPKGLLSQQNTFRS